MKRWLGIAKSSTPDLALAEALKAHISDLRVLLDKSDEREAQLLAMVKAEHDARYYRPVVTGKPPENRSLPAIPAENLSDVAIFDEKADAEQIEHEEELNRELNALMNEQNTEGVHKVEA